MNRKHVSSEMDSGLGSDEDRSRGRTKEQKQLHNEQLLSGCFIDAASLSDDADVADQRRLDERRQGAMLFQTSVPHFSVLQMPSCREEREFSCSSGSLPQFPETSTPFNSIVQLASDEPRNKSPLGFYVDLSDVAGGDSAAPSSASATKNIFSMVIDFEGPKKDKPVKLSSSLVSFRRSKPLNKSNLLAKSNGSLSSSFSSINSNSVAGTSRQSEELEPRASSDGKALNIEVLSASLVKNLSVSSKSSSSSEIVVEGNNELDLDKDSTKESVEEDHIECDNVSEKNDDIISPLSSASENSKVQISEEIKAESQPRPQQQQFVRLSDLECQRARVEVPFAPRMSRSIPESSWVESPLLMSGSVGYRSAPRPMEPEGEEEAEAGDKVPEEVGGRRERAHAPRKCVRKLGTDLLRMFLEEIGPDVVVEVEGHKLKAHKCILASRCQYFAALLSGNWLEDKSGNVISLQGFSYESVYFALCHIYSGAAHVPESISLVELASLADTLGLEGLKEVVEVALQHRHCHDFHRPCAGCCAGVLEVLPLSAAYGLDDLYQKCLKWITQHFVRVWPSRAFASLPRELRDKCYQQHVVHMQPDKVLDTILQCDKVLATLPSMRWAEPVSQLVLQLTDACHLYHRQHFAAVLASQYVIGLDAGLGFGVCQIEEQMVSAAKNLGIDQACRSYSRCCKMLDQTWSRPFADLLNKVKLQLEQCLVGQADRLIRSNAWLRLDTNLRTRIKELSPSMETSSRLPRATPLRPRKPPPTSLSSSDSSRNSSPGVARQGARANALGGSPSLRRSLLLAAKAPQVPPSPTTNRRSTLTQPTAASAARAAAAKTAGRAPLRAPVAAPRSSSAAPQQRSTAFKAAAPSQGPSKKTSTVVSRNPSMGKKDAPTTLASRKPDCRSASPLKADSRLSSPRKGDSSRVTSPVKVDVRSPSPMRGAAGAPRRVAKGTKCLPVKVAEVRPQPAMQRSSTFLKEEPSVLGKVM